ncbi:GlsB/YeaQ/YmgE family stress response membrane protein [Benzoatithermus flavus]|uniref:GlsB/YeaQ/YmgE family stress response membrane protein n=1 Tax=Benzoatithermus flavus TaxID=3108223 RepID=A0ABU8XPI9_9PROT
MSIIAWIVLGLIAGAIAKLLMPGRDPGGIFITIVIGIVGAIIGGFIGSALGFGDVTGVNFPSLLIAVLGSIILLIIYRMVRRPTV